LGPQDMLWVESQHREPGDNSLAPPSQNRATSEDGMGIGRVRWYRLPGMTFTSP
jgi:hypothetical protein